MNLKFFFKGDYLKSILYQVSGNSLAQVISVITIPIISNLYGPEVFGKYSLSLQYISFFSLVIGLRLEYLITKIQIDWIWDYLINYLKLVLILSIIIIVIIYPTSLFQDLNIVFIVIISVIFNLNTINYTNLQRLNFYKNTAISEILNKASFSLIAIALNDFKSVTALLASFLMSQSIKLAYLIKVFIKKNTNIYVKKQSLRNTFSKVKNESISWTFSSLIQISLGLIPFIFIERVFSLDSLGQYSLVISILYLPSTLIAQSVGQVYYERCINFLGRKKSPNVLFRFTLKRILQLALVGYPLIYFSSDYVISLVLSEEWDMVSTIIKIMTIPMFISFISTAFDRSCYIFSFNKYPIYYNLFRSLSTILFLFIVFIFEVNFISFLKFYSLLLSLHYSVDFYASYFMQNETTIN